MRPIASLHECRNGVEHETLVMDTGLVVSYDMVDGVRVGYHRQVPRQSLSLVVQRLRAIAIRDSEHVTN